MPILKRDKVLRCVDCKTKLVGLKGWDYDSTKPVRCPPCWGIFWKRPDAVDIWRKDNVKG